LVYFPFGYKKEQGVHVLARSKILYIEDQEMAQVAGVAVLEALNCDIDVANTGKEAIALCAKNRYKFVLLDLGLPDATVATMVKHIRRYQGEKTPIIAVTAYSSSLVEKQCLDAGMSEFIQKPLTYDKVEFQLGPYLKKRFVFF
jgi:two-component system aerobic respiration control sensor histidine kinase ArcB